jgi:hypothetical protein
VSTDSRAGVTLEELAEHKRLPVPFLIELGLREVRGAIEMPYYDRAGTEVAAKRRTAVTATGNSWWPRGMPTRIYTRKGVTPARGDLWTVEGESDCWTLWYHDEPAIGVPGASNWGALEIDDVGEADAVNIVQEPGEAGDRFPDAVVKRLRALKWRGTARIVRMPEGVKDPSDLHRRETAVGFKAALDRAVRDARVVAVEPIEEITSPTRARSSGTTGTMTTDDVIETSGVLALKAESSTDNELQRSLRLVEAGAASMGALDREILRRRLIATLASVGYNKGAARLADAAIPCRIAAGRQEERNGSAALFTDVDPWPDEVDGCALLDELEQAIGRYMVLPKYAGTALALWIVHTHTIDAAQITPRLAIGSPTRRCGKTTLLKFLEATTRKALHAANISTAALFRSIEAFQPTILIDEADAFLEIKGNEEINTILNGGHDRGSANVVRCVGDNFEPTPFRVFAPVAVAGIGRRRETLMDRSIVIEMRRRSPGETVARFRRREREALTTNLGRRIARWAKDNLEALRLVPPKVLPELNDRAADNWEPLLAIADVVGGAWPARAMEAALRLSGDGDGDGDDDTGGDRGTDLLSDIRELWGENDWQDRVTSAELLLALAGMEGRPWAEICHGKPITSNYLARLLRRFKVRPKSLRIDEGRTPKGYLLAQFQDPWTRYLSPDPRSENATPATRVGSLQESGIWEPQQGQDVASRGGHTSGGISSNVAAVAGAGERESPGAGLGEGFRGMVTDDGYAPWFPRDEDEPPWLAGAVDDSAADEEGP